MRPTVIRLIAGGALGIAFSVSLMLPGTVVFPQESQVQHLAAPEPPSAKVIRVAPIATPRKKAPARPRVVVQRIYVPAIRTAPAPAVVRPTQPRPERTSRPPRKPVERTQPPPPSAQSLTPMSAPPTEPEQAETPRKAKKPKEGKPQKADEPRKSEKPRESDKPKKSGKPKKSDKPKRSKDRSSGKKDKGDDGDRRGGDDGDEHGHDDQDHEDGGGRGDKASRG